MGPQISESFVRSKTSFNLTKEASPNIVERRLKNVENKLTDSSTYL